MGVTRNLARRNMRCDNYCPRCGELEESVTHAIFECPPALQVWSLSSIPTSPYIFPVPSVYTNMNYLFWRKNAIIEPEQDIDPLELVRYAESECQAWFKANKVVQPMVQDINCEESQVISVGPNFGQYHKWAATKGMGLKRPEPIARTRARELPRRSRGRLTIKEEEETRKRTR